jgi:hypothetical protein
LNAGLVLRKVRCYGSIETTATNERIARVMMSAEETVMESVSTYLELTVKTTLQCGVVPHKWR